MILEFMTKRNTNGHRNYLAIDTGAMAYSRQCRYMVMDGIEVSAKAYKELVEKCVRNEYTERDYVC